MPIGNYQWWEVTESYFRIKFANTLDIDTLINSNFQVYINETGSPIEVTTDDPIAYGPMLNDPFQDIVQSRDYSSISRTLTLWWDNPPDISGEHILYVDHLKTFVGSLLDDFIIPFEWDRDTSTGDNMLVTIPPSRTPSEVEDYSIKAAGWTSVESSIDSSVVGGGHITILDVAPPVSTHHYLDAIANEGRIDILFSSPIAMNYLTTKYFALSRKQVKKGLAQWEALETAIISDETSSVISVYVPAAEASADPTDPIYSYRLTDEEVTSHEFFLGQHKYRLIVSKAIGI